MRSSTMGKYWVSLLAILLPPVLWGQAGQDPLASARQTFQEGEFRRAAVAFQQILDLTPSEKAYAGLVESLLKLDDLKAAEKSSVQALRAFPQSGLAHAVRGDVFFRRGLIPEAGDEYQAALNIDPDCARAWLGLGKVEDAHAERGRARESIAKSHQLDPSDGDALYEWAIRQSYPENVSGLEKHLAGFHSDPDIERHEREYVELLKALAGRHVWILNPEVERADIKMDPLLFGPDLARRGYSLRVGFNDRASATLMLDTGSSGVTITRKFAEKVGATKLSEQLLQGIGNGARPGYSAWVDKVTIGSLQFHDCFVHVVPDAIAETDGLIGTDIFTQFLVTLDFRAGKLRLNPLFETTSAGKDHTSEAKDFSPAYGFGHLLLLPTQTANATSGLFVLDSGSNLSSVSEQVAEHSSQMRSVTLPVSGAGGRTNSTYIGDGMTLEFSKMRRGNQRLISADLRSVSKSLGTEVSGQIGFATLESLRVVIDYRDGLVKFEEKSK
jgi:predicted aspartyl protease